MKSADSVCVKSSTRIAFFVMLKIMLERNIYFQNGNINIIGIYVDSNGTLSFIDFIHNMEIAEQFDDSTMFQVYESLFRILSLHNANCLL